METTLQKAKEKGFTRMLFALMGTMKIIFLWHAYICNNYLNHRNNFDSCNRKKSQASFNKIQKKGVKLPFSIIV